MEAAQIERELRWLLASKASTVGTPLLRQFTEKAFDLQWVIAELGLAEDGPDGTFEWHDQYGFIADPHLNTIIDFTDPDCPNAVNARLLKIAVLLTRDPLPEWVLQHLRSVRRCYAFELYDVVWVSLRALVEAASFAALLKSGVVKRDANVRYLAEHSVRACLKDVERSTGVPRKQVAAMHRIVDRANALVHGKGKTDLPSEAETFQAIQAVVKFVEVLFR